VRGAAVGLLAAGLAAAAVAAAAPRATGPRVDPGRAPALPSAVEAAARAVVAIRAQVPPDRPSAATLGTERGGAAVLIEPDGLAVTVGYLVLEAAAVEATLPDGRTVPARVVGHDLESGLGLVRVAAPGPLPVLALGQPAALAAGQPVSIVGAGSPGHPSATAARLLAVRPFVGYWEYLLERALVVAPPHDAFGGAALVSPEGTLVGVVSLRVPEGHVAIPIDLLPPVREALLAAGRPARPPRPWLGVRVTEADGGVGILGVAPAGPAQQAGLRPGDVVVRLDEERVADVGDFYRRLWRRAVGEAVVLTVRREGALERVTVRPADRYLRVPLRSP
jgi:S1-C subfamily serine protease